MSLNMYPTIAQVPSAAFNSNSVYTTPPLPPNIINIPKQYAHMLAQEGYQARIEGRAVRLEDFPEGFAVWTGMETFCDVTNGLTLRLHPTALLFIHRRGYDLRTGNLMGIATHQATAPPAKEEQLAVRSYPTNAMPQGFGQSPQQRHGFDFNSQAQLRGNVPGAPGTRR